MKRVVFFMSIVFIYLIGLGCFSPKKIYNKKISRSERLKISYQYYRDCRSVYTLLYNEKKISTTFTLRDCPDNFVITKQNVSDGNVNYHYSMVTDTIHHQFKCIDFNFLPQYCNATVARTFIPINGKEKEILKKIQTAIRSKGYKEQLSDDDINRFIGWVKISY